MTSIKRFDVTLLELRQLMENRGLEAVEKVLYVFKKKFKRFFLHCN